MRDRIWSYINRRYDDDGVLVHGDEIYLAFQLQFDNGLPTELTDEVMEGFIGIHDLEDIIIEWEGDLGEGYRQHKRIIERRLA